MAESFSHPNNDGAEAGDAAPAAPARRRPKPGERRVQILQTLAAMLEQPGGERITTAALAARLEVSEAALYRHFASKAQMFEGLIEFIEQSVFALVAQIVERDMPDAPHATEGTRRAARVVAMVLQFGERNPGMVRVMVGDALVFEHERLQQRMGQFFDRIESTLRQCLRGPPKRPAPPPRRSMRMCARPCCATSCAAGCSAMRAAGCAARRPSTSTPRSHCCCTERQARSRMGVTGMALPGPVDKLGDR